MPYTPTNFSTTAVINADTLFQNYDDEVQVLMSDVGNYLTEEMVKVYTETEIIVTDGIKVNSVETIEDLATQDGVVFKTIIVKDTNRGGTFIWSATGTSNGGTVFAGATGYWNRQYSGAVNVKWFGAIGDGVADDTVAIQNAINTGKDILLIDGIFVSTIESISNNIYFVNASISTSTLSINSTIYADRIKIFSDNTEVTINGNDVIYPEWFGVRPNYDENNFSNSKRMMRCVQYSSGHLVFGIGTYYIRDLLIDGSNVMISGQGRGTILKNAVNTWIGSTRFGTFIAIYSPNLNVSNYSTLSNYTWTATTQCKNVKIYDLDIEWDDTTVATTDLSMNGISILGFKNVHILNVNINLHGANRAIYIGTWLSDQKTENIFIDKCNTYNSCTGVFVTEGTNTSSTGNVLKNVNVKDSIFNVDSTPSNGTRGVCSGLYHHGTPSTTIDAGNIYFKNNIVNGGGAGIVTNAPTATTKLASSLFIEENTFNNFTEQGVFTYSTNIVISNNTFNTTVLNFIAVQLSAILLYSNSYGGCLNARIINNKIINLSGNGTIRAISISPVNNNLHEIESNNFIYSNNLYPQYDVFYLDSSSYLGDIILSKNIFKSTGSANVRGTTTGGTYYFIDKLDNKNMSLYNTTTKYYRQSYPTTGTWNKGDRIYNSIPSVGQPKSWVCTVAGTPCTWVSEGNL